MGLRGQGAVEVYQRYGTVGTVQRSEQLMTLAVTGYPPSTTANSMAGRMCLCSFVVLVVAKV